MQEFLHTLLICSATMSIISVLFMLLSPALSKRYSAKGQYYAWLVIIIGFIIPFRPSFNLGQLSANLPNSYVQEYITTSIISFTSNLDIAQNTTTLTDIHKASAYEILFAIWILGAMAILAYNLIRHYLTIRMINRWKENITDELTLSIFQKQKEALGIKKEIAIQGCPLIASSMLTGLMKPVILLQSAQYSSEELSFIIKHELVHFKQRDLLVKALLLTAKMIHWFNPAIYLLARAVSVQCEKACDDAVVGSDDFATRKKYALLVSNTIKKQLGIQTSLATNFYGGSYTIKSRLISILEAKNRKAGVAMLCCILTCVLCTGMIFPKTDNVFETVDNQSIIKSDMEKGGLAIEEIGIIATKQKEYTENVADATSFVGVASNYSATNMYDNSEDNSWRMSFQWMSGRTVSELNYYEGSPQRLKISSHVESGNLTIQLAQDDKVIDLPLGEHTVPLDSFEEGEISVIIASEGAGNGYIYVESLHD